MRNRALSLKHDADVALQRFAELRQQSEDGRGDPRLVDQVLEELSVALHELEAGSDELRDQNERLLVAENRLSEERRRYQELFEFGPDGYFVTTATAVIREANRMAGALLGVASLNLFGKPLSVFVQIDRRPTFRTLINSMAAGEMTTQTLETSIIRRGGGQFPAVLRVTAARSPRTANVELRWTLRDVSAERAAQQALVAEIEERKRAEESLRGSELRFRHLVEHATDIVYELDGNGRFTFCNERATQRILGYTERELLGRRLLDLVPRAEVNDGLLDVVFVPEAQRAKLTKYLSDRINHKSPRQKLTVRRGQHLQIEWENSPIHIDDTTWPTRKDRTPLRSNAIDIRVDPAALVFLT